MALYTFQCKKCDLIIKKMLKPHWVDAVTCPTCKSPVERLISPPATQVTETLDNGFMPKKIVRLKDAERLYKERSKKYS